MRKLLLFIIGFIFSLSSLFAETTVDIYISDSQVNLGESFTLELNIDTDTQGNINVQEVVGAESFTIFGISESTQAETVNGVTMVNKSYQLNMVPKSLGEFTLGPVILEVGSNNIESNQVSINVIDPQSQTIQNQDTNISKNIDNNTNQEKNNTLNGELDDIHPVKNLDIRIDYFQFKYVLFFFGIIIFIFIFYYFLSRALEVKNMKEINKKQEQEDEGEKDAEKKEIYNLLSKLSEKGEEYTQEDFYSELNILFRRYFLLLNINNADKKTLKELSNENINKKLLDLFSVSYMYEFSTKDDSYVERKQLIMNFMIYLKK